MIHRSNFNSLDTILDYVKEVDMDVDPVVVMVRDAYKSHMDDFVLNNPRGDVSQEFYDRMTNRYAFRMTFRQLEKKIEEHKKQEERKK